ncbi:MAG: hypothetical protein ACOYVK_09550 [Bacillota bacterium]
MRLMVKGDISLIDHDGYVWVYIDRLTEFVPAPVDIPIVELLILNQKV